MVSAPVPEMFPFHVSVAVGLTSKVPPPLWSVTGRPVGYALVILLEQDQRVFANEAGRFSLSGLHAGAATLRVQQIGYRPVCDVDQYTFERQPLHG